MVIFDGKCESEYFFDLEKFSIKLPLKTVGDYIVSRGTRINILIGTNGIWDETAYQETSKISSQLFFHLLAIRISLLKDKRRGLKLNELKSDLFHQNRHSCEMTLTNILKNNNSIPTAIPNHLYQDTLYNHATTQ